MKKILTFIITAAAVIVAGCDNNIPERGTVNNALVTEVVLDETLRNGLSIERGLTISIPELISALPEDATNLAQYYESSDPSIADVSETGILEAKSIGTCTITVYVGTDGIYAEFEVTVTRPKDIAVTALRFNQESAEYDKEESNTVNIKSMLYIGSESDTEAATENILFSSSDPEVASIDDNGILTVKKLGETTVTAQAEFSQIDGSPIKATMTIKFYKWVEYERFPGDKDGNPRAIMGTSASEWDAIPHTDGGWTMAEFGWLNDSTQKDKWANTSKRNCYRYALLDGRYIVSRGGDNNNLPTASNGTAFCWQRPGGNKQEKESDGAYFIIDMKQSQVVSYFRIVNISDHADDRGIRLTRVSEILGSNDLSDWKTIASGIEGWNPRTFDGVQEYRLESLKATFDNETPYRYIKFVMNKKDRCYGYFNNPDDPNSDRDGNAIQVAELYMGYKQYTE